MHTTAIALLMLVLATPAWASLNFLKDAPITRLKAEELKAFHAFVQKTLSEGADGVAAEWTAPKTKFTSKVTPTARFKDGAVECRSAGIDSDAHDRRAMGTYTFCRNAKGDWGIKNPSKSAKRPG